MRKSLPEFARYLLDVLPLPHLTTILDVGANPIMPAPYSELLAAKACRVIGFEPQPEAFAKLQKRKSETESYFPHAVGDGRRLILHVMKFSGFTSTLPIYQPSLRLLGAPQWGHKVSEIEFDSVALDDVTNLGAVDMLKIDIQGGELSVLQSARKTLAQAVAIIIEHRYLRLYEGEPMVGAVDVELRDQGFELHKFLFKISRAVANSQMSRLNTRRVSDQLIDGDAVYLRDISKLEAYSDAQLGHLALLAASTFSSHSLVLRCLDELVLRGCVPSDAPGAYVERLPSEFKA